MSRTSIRQRAQLLVVATTALVLAGCLIPSSASAYWSVSTTVPSSGAARAATMNQGLTPTATVATQNDITVSWAASTLSNGTAVARYTVTRYSSTNVASAATGGCAGTLTALSCTEANVPDGLWTYAITPRFAVNWLGAESTRSAAVRSDATLPVNGITRTAVSGGSFLNGTTLYYRGGSAGSLRLVNTVSDLGGSGPASSRTSALQGTSTGFSHTPSTVATPVAGPYTSNLLSWTGTATSAPSIVVTGTDNAGNPQATTLALVRDVTAPTGGAISYTNGVVRTATLAVALTAVADTGSGVASRVLQRRTVTLTNNTCPGFAGAWTTVATNPTGASFSDAVTADTCVQYQYVLTDSVGNAQTAGSASVAKVKSAYNSVVLTTPGILDYFRLGETSAATTMVDSAGTANNGTFFGGPIRGDAGAIAGDANTAVTYDGVNDYSQINRSIQNSFSIELWFKSTQGVGTGAQWWNGAGLVDAEVSGANGDFGVSLSADGRVMAGVGNPDTTASSATGYNNGAWHHVVMTRSQTTGQVILYVDGAQVATVTGNTQALSASANIRFGSSQTNVNFFAGSLDEVALYSTALTPAQVSNHYLSGLP